MHRVAIAYLAGAWLVIQVAETLLPVFDFGNNAVRVVVIALAIGFVPVLVLSWSFEWTASGLVRDSATAGATPVAPSKTFDRVVTAVLAVAVAYFAIDKFILSAPMPAADKSIAVLPLANISGDPEQDYFGIGISVELTNMLASIPNLRVISSETIRTFSGREFNVVEAARKMNVTHIISGVVRKAGNRIRVAVELFDASEDTQLWSHSYERELDDIFAIQDDIAARVVGQLRLQLSDEPPTSEQINPRAYELYLEGHYLSHTVRTPEAFPRAERLLTEAVELEPGFVPALWSLARSISNQVDERDVAGRQEKMTRVRALVDRMVELAPDSGYANGWLAYLAELDGADLQTVATYRERAIAGGTDTNVYLQMSRGVRMLALTGRIDEAIALARYVVERDPACSTCVYQLVYVYRQAGWHERAALELEKLLEWREGSVGIFWSLGVAWLVAGAPDKALAYFAQATPGPGELGRLMALHDLGRTAEFEAALEEAQAEDRFDAEGLARIYAWTGQNDRAFALLERMVRVQGPSSVANVKTDLYEPIKSDPRWQAFLERYGATDDDLLQIEFDPPLPPEVVAEAKRIRAEREQ